MRKFSTLLIAAVAIFAGNAAVSQSISTEVQALTPGASLEAIEVGDVFEVSFILDNAGSHAGFVFDLKFGSTWEEWSIPEGESSFFTAAPVYAPDWTSGGNQTDHSFAPNHLVYLDQLANVSFQSFSADTTLATAQFEYLGESLSDPTNGGELLLSVRVDGSSTVIDLPSVVYTPVPEPGSFAIFFLVGSSLLVSRRRALR